MKMRWTSISPRDVGWYWFKADPDWKPPSHLLRSTKPVIILVGKHKTTPVVRFPAFDLIVRDMRGSWFGPLKPPEMIVP